MNKSFDILGGNDGIKFLALEKLPVCTSSERRNLKGKPASCCLTPLSKVPSLWQLFSFAPTSLTNLSSTPPSIFGGCLWYSSQAFSIHFRRIWWDLWCFLLLEITPVYAVFTLWAGFPSGILWPPSSQIKALTFLNRKQKFAKTPMIS